MVSESKEKEVEITYRFNHPREAVFAAWTHPEYLPQWFAPFGCTIEFKTLEIKPGGTFHSCVRNPDFGDCWCVGEYKEVEVPQRLVFTMINADEDGNRIDPKTTGMDEEWPGETLVTVTFHEEGRKTIVHLKQTVSELTAKKTGAYPGWIQMLERLETFISHQNEQTTK